MLPRKILWDVLTVVLIVSLCLTIAKYLLDKAPGLLFIGVILAVSFPIALRVSPRTKKRYKAMFLTASVVAAGFTVGLYSGLWESVILLDDSYIDISRCAVVLHLKNNGLTEVIVNQIEVGNTSFTVSSPYSVKGLQPSETANLVIYYVEKNLQLLTDRIEIDFDPWWGADVSVNQEVIPSTFQSGDSYPVVLTTNSVLKHRFSVEAKRTLDEKLDIKASMWHFENSVAISIRFNNTGSNYLYLYSIKIADVVFKPEPPAVIPYYDSNHLALYFEDEPAISWTSNMIIHKISATPKPELDMLEMGATYDILVRTMADNLYVTNVTI